ncbi:MAG: ATP-binding cassette domain-containing protein, partial [Planctomycetota bacterium]
MEAISSKPKGGVPVTLEGVTVRAAGRVLLDDNSLEIPAGKITVIVGGSGAGKSVLLRILSGLIPRSGYPLSWSGSIRYGDNDVSSGADGRVGIVFQQFALFDELSVTANVQFAIDHRRDPRVPPAQNASDWLKELRVPTGVPVSALSGGQKQRLAIARTLAADPEIILYDEPTSGLDAASGRQVAELIQRTQLAHRRTSIVVTHDYETLLNIADHVLLLDASRQQMISIPRNEWSRVPEKLQPVQQSDNSGETISTPSSGRRIANQMLGATDEFVSTSGSAIVALLRLPIDILPAWRRPMWGIRFTLHYLKLVAGPSAWVYLVMSGLIVGFTSTYFTFRFLPHQL